MRVSRLAAPALGLCLGLLALGPGVLRGFLLTYDMLFVPREPFSAALPGLTPPRAVPSDLVVAFVSQAVPGDIVQKIVLLAVFVLGCSGVAALLDREPVVARLAGGTFYVWNPYVAERLVLGHWGLLLGYAGLPWVLRAALKPDLASPRGAGRLCLALLPAVIGSFAAMAITALVLVPAVLFSRGVRTVAVALGALLLGSLPWLIPSFLHQVYADPAGVSVFASRADTPFGALGSLLMLGGAWNSQTVPKAYGGALSILWLAVVVVALAGLVALTRERRFTGLAVSGVLGLLIACIGVTAAGRSVLRAGTEFWSGLAVFRDAQQFVAPLALAEACGFGVAVAWVMNPSPFVIKKIKQRRTESADLAGVALGLLALLAPVLFLPGMAWGAAGRLRPAWYPADWIAAAQVIDQNPAQGAVLVLPWETYRTPSWNHGERMLDPWPRLLSRPVLWNDGTQVGDVRLAPDDPRARALDGAIRGSGPLTATLRAAGIRFVVDDAEEPSQRAGPRLPGAKVIIDRPGLIVAQLPD